MRLWIQCDAGFDDPGWVDYLKCAERHAIRAARPDTEIAFHGSIISHPPGIISYSYAQFLHASLAIKCAIQAEKEGFDAFTQDIMADRPELSEVVEIPVIMPVESRLHVACLLGRRVAFLCMNEKQRRRLEDAAKLYGFRDRALPGSWIPLTPPDLQAGFKNPEPVVKAAAAEIKNLGKQGADVVICAGTPLAVLLVEQGVTDIDGVIVLDTIGAVVKVAEMMMDLRKIGMTASRRGQHTPIPREEMAAIRKVYGVE